MLLTALLFSTGGAAIKATDLSAWQVASFRSAVAAVALLCLLRPSRRWSWGALAVGGAYAATMVLYVAANKLTTAANTIFLQSTAPAYLLLLAPRILGEPLRRRDVLFAGALAVGSVLFFLGGDAASPTAPDPLRGNALAAVCGLTWALTILGLRRLEREGSGAAGAVALGNVVAAAVALPGAVPVVEIAARDAAVVAYLGVFQIALAYVFMTRAVRSLPAFEVSLLLLFEPVASSLWAWVLHDERPAPVSVLGASVILLATVAHLVAVRRAVRT